MNEALIIDACRTPRGIGKVGKGALADIHPQQLGATVLKALKERNNLNTADVAALDSLPGVGPVMAARIIAWRDQHGRFTTIDQLREVSGIGPRTFERLRPSVRV
jgi:comEA protein